MWYIYMVEFYLTIKTNKIAGKSTELENIFIMWDSQAQKDTVYTPSNGALSFPVVIYVHLCGCTQKGAYEWG